MSTSSHETIACMLVAEAISALVFEQKERLNGRPDFTMSMTPATVEFLTSEVDDTEHSNMHDGPNITTVVLHDGRRIKVTVTEERDA
jgi:hypothetical protein